jgi:hypothetical protein
MDYLWLSILNNPENKYPECCPGSTGIYPGASFLEPAGECKAAPGLVYERYKKSSGSRYE